ncbi:MAG TPA: hypothetical protein VLL52_20845 [Anaerolineae bacterium]|nr:hypothetical protein [Anaerolineae bacterium]
MRLYGDKLFAPIDADLHLERVAGGNETEVYCTDDKRFVVKVKEESGGDLETALTEIRWLRETAEMYVDLLGDNHTIPSYFIVAKNGAGQIKPLIIQPYLLGAQALFDIEYEEMSRAERRQLAAQLRDIIKRSRHFYRETGKMPDLYGRKSASEAERRYRNRWWRFPNRVWSFVVQRNMLRAHNLMLAEDGRVMLVDYDPVRRGELYQKVYYTVRRILFWRDLGLIRLMEWTGVVWPRHK